MKMDDSSSYAPLLEGVNKLVDAIRPSKFPCAETRNRAALLKSIMKGVADFCESHAINQKPGLARALYTEVSGHAGLPIFRRFDAALTAASNAAPSPAKPAAVSTAPSATQRRDGGGSRRSGFNNRSRETPRQQRDISEVMCFGCRSFGHYRDKCPNRNQDKANN